MNGKAAKKLRRAFGAKTHAYRVAKRQVDTMPTSFAQRTKPEASGRSPRKREPGKPTWPRTEDQHAQSRPLIVVHPRRQTDKAHRALTKMPAKIDRETWGFYPKHVVDAFALRHPTGA